ncbi:hypothetical protein D3C85_940170 [compost metagenome]
MGNHEHTGAVGHEDGGAIDLGEFVLDGLDTGGTVELIGFQGRYAAYVGQLGLQQCLPMFGNMITQARHDQNGCDSLNLVHLTTFIFSMTRPARRPEVFVELTLKSTHPVRFSLDVSHFSFHDKRPTAHALKRSTSRCKECAVASRSRPSSRERSVSSELLFAASEMVVICREMSPATWRCCSVAAAMCSTRS